MKFGPNLSARVYVCRDFLKVIKKKLIKFQLLPVIVETKSCISLASVCIETDTA